MKLTRERLQFVITDGVGYVISDPIEGWTFTILLESAAKFDFKGDAIDCIREHYRGRSHELEVKEVLTGEVEKLI
jgi:hypothetical protein